MRTRICNTLISLTIITGVPSCTPSAPSVDASQPDIEQSDLSVTAALIGQDRLDQACWETAILPAEYEQNPEASSSQITKDHIDSAPVSDRKSAEQKIIKPQEEVRYRSLCADQKTPEFLSSLQRALAVRDYYQGPITGKLDTPTQAAIKRYQEAKGSRLPTITLETARELGLIAINRNELSS